MMDHAVQSFWIGFFIGVVATNFGWIFFGMTNTLTHSHLLTYNDMVEIISHISYKPGWSLMLGVSKDAPDHPYLQVMVSEESDASLCSNKRDGTRTPWKSGKRYLSKFMCKQEIVGVAFDLFKSAELHEVHEWFRYHNRSIYNPHLDPDKLADFAGRRENYITRDNAMSMDELK